MRVVTPVLPEPVAMSTVVEMPQPAPAVAAVAQPTVYEEIVEPTEVIAPVERFM